jgi:hypothetical protein
LVLRGIKTAELRSISTTIIGERFYIYSPKAKATPLCRSGRMTCGSDRRRRG